MDTKAKFIKTLVYILPDKDAGVASVVRNLLRFKTNRYATKVVLLHNLLDDASRRIKDNFNADDIVRITYHGKWSSKYTIYKKILKELNSNSIIISNDGGVELDALRYQNYPISVVYIFHGDFKHYFNVLNEKQSSISSVITVSEFLKTKLKNKFGQNSNMEVQSIKFPVPFVESYERTISDRIRLVFVGSLNNRKGVMSLYDIASLLDKQSVDYHLSIIGQGEKESELKVLFKENEKVSFLGKLDNRKVFEIYAEHDIILLPSKGEGLPVVLVEAMKHGVVPMATNLESGIPEIIEHGVNGFTIPIDEVSNYASYIEQLYHNRDQLKKMSELCIIKSQGMFHPFDQAKLYEDTIVNTNPVTITNRMTFNILDRLPMVITRKIKHLLKK